MAKTPGINYLALNLMADHPDYVVLLSLQPQSEASVADSMKKYYHSLFQQSGLRGITIVAPSGDYGAGYE